jgi:alkyl hydroperoxide reductase subunit AhpF
MALISSADQQKLRDAFAVMTRSVRLLFFTQTFDCETCSETRQILDELPLLSDKITIEEVNLVLDGEKAKEYGIDRAPAVAITYLDGSPDRRDVSQSLNAGQVENVTNSAGWRDSRVRFLGAPAGYEFVSLVQAVLLAGGRPPNLSEQSQKRLSSVDRPVVMQVFTTPT